MTVYVDSAIHRRRGRLWCHMWSEDTAEMHAFAASIGLSRSWFQAPPRAQWRHYDLTSERRGVAVLKGAVETDRYGALEHVARTRGDGRTLDRIAGLRARRDASDDAAAASTR